MYSCAAAWTAEVAFLEDARDADVESLLEAKSLVRSAPCGNGNEEIELNREINKKIFDPNPEEAARLIKSFSEGFLAEDFRSRFGEVSLLGVKAVISALSMAAASEYQTEIAYAISYDADRLAELFALGVWARRGTRALQKVAKAGAKPNENRPKPAARFVLNKDEGNNGYKFWMTFINLTGLFDATKTKDILNQYHEWVLFHLNKGSKAKISDCNTGDDFDFKDRMKSILLEEIKRRQRKNTVADVEKAFKAHMTS